MKEWRLQRELGRGRRPFGKSGTGANVLRYNLPPDGCAAPIFTIGGIFVDDVLLSTLQSMQQSDQTLQHTTYFGNFV